METNRIATCSVSSTSKRIVFIIHSKRGRTIAFQYYYNRRLKFFHCLTLSKTQLLSHSFASSEVWAVYPYIPVSLQLYHGRCSTKYVIWSGMEWNFPSQKNVQFTVCKWYLLAQTQFLDNYTRAWSLDHWVTSIQYVLHTVDVQYDYSKLTARISRKFQIAYENDLS